MFDFFPHFKESKPSGVKKDLRANLLPRNTASSQIKEIGDHTLRNNQMMHPNKQIYP